MVVGGTFGGGGLGMVSWTETYVVDTAEVGVHIALGIRTLGGIRRLDGVGKLQERDFAFPADGDVEAEEEGGLGVGGGVGATRGGKEGPPGAGNGGPDLVEVGGSTVEVDGHEGVEIENGNAGLAGEMLGGREVLLLEGLGLVPVVDEDPDQWPPGERVPVRSVAEQDV